MTTSETIRRDLYFPRIDGLRSIAIMAVVIYHYYPATLPGGFVGVDLFFVISGFLVTGNLLKESNHNFHVILDFWIRRIIRIFPALLTVLLLGVIISYIFFTPNEMASSGLGVLGGATSTANLIAAYLNESYFFDAGQTMAWTHLWSLGVEEQYYLGIGIVFFIFRNSQKSRTIALGVIIILSFLIGAYLQPIAPIRAFYLPFGRMWELAIGGLLYYFSFRSQRVKKYQSLKVFGLMEVAGLVTLIIAFTSLRPGNLYPGWEVLIPVLGTCLLLSSSKNKTINSVLTNRVARYVGKISFPLYLWHWPLLIWPEIILGRSETDTERFTAFALAVLLSVATYHFIENPIRFGPQTTKNKRALALSAAMLVVALAGGTIHFSNGYFSLISWRVQHSSGPVRNLFAPVDFNWAAQVRTDECHLQTSNWFSEQCFINSKSAVTLWGDSLAASLYPGLEQTLSPFKIKVQQLTVAGCPPLLKVHSLYRKDCPETETKILKSLVANPPSVLLIHAAWRHEDYPLTGGEFRSSLSKSFERYRLTLPKTRIVVIGPMPVWRTSPREVTLKKWIVDGSSPTLPSKMQVADSMKSTSQTVEAIANSMSIEYLAPSDLLCTRELCLARVSNRAESFTAIDKRHLSKIGSLFFANYIDRKLNLTNSWTVKPIF